jgi:hypothetical protein
LRAKVKKMRFKLIGKGGQGVLFLSKVIAEALLAQGVIDFAFLKEFDEGQRSGEIKVTFNLPFDSDNKNLIIRKNNIVELKRAAKYLNLNESCIKKALKKIKPEAFQKNIKVWLEK